MYYHLVSFSFASMKISFLTLKWSFGNGFILYKNLVLYTVHRENPFVSKKKILKIVQVLAL